jgi:hypothetical protein
MRLYLGLMLVVVGTVVVMLVLLVAVAVVGAEVVGAVVVLIDDILVVDLDVVVGGPLGRSPPRTQRRQPIEDRPRGALLALTR